MNERKYNSVIEFMGSLLRIEIKYEYLTTKEEVERDLDYYQWKFSRDSGRKVRREGITVKPGEGELREVTTNFTVKLKKPLWIGLRNIYQKAPYVLPKLIEDLEEYKNEYDLQNEAKRLIQHTIAGLEEIIKSKEHPPFKPINN